MSTPPDRNKPDDKLPAALQIGLPGDAEDRSPAPSEFFTAWLSPVLESDTAMLRHRLRVVALVAGMILAVRFLYSEVGPAFDGLGALWGGCALFAFATAGLLFSRRPLSNTHLRVIEFVFFGLLTLGLLVAQYRMAAALVAQGDGVGAVGVLKNGVLAIVVLLVVYGLMIPQDLKTAAQFALTMAVGPLAVLTLLYLQHTDSADLFGKSSTLELALSNATFLVLGAGIAILGALLSNRRGAAATQSIPEYQLGEKIGSGTLGELYVAQHPLLKRPCALKLIDSALVADANTQASIEQQLEIATALSHPNTIQVFDHGQNEDGTFFYAMEYLPGSSVADLVERFGPLPPGRAVYIARQACKALAETHRLELIHRKLEPVNVFVAILGGECDVAKILDVELVSFAAVPDGPGLTAERLAGGAPGYMSPEQACGSVEIDGRSDIYALGAILHFMLTAKPPLENGNRAGFFAKYAADSLCEGSVMSEHVPPDLEAVAMRCLSASAANRYPDVHAVSTALGKCRCAADWDASRAEAWWLEQASKELPQEAGAHDPRSAAL
jgi:eukaryotic-like serine/threonine-protein kinase